MNDKTFLKDCIRCGDICDSKSPKCRNCRNNEPVKLFNPETPAEKKYFERYKKSLGICCALILLFAPSVAMACSDEFKAAVNWHAESTPDDPCDVGWAELLLGHCERGSYQSICEEARRMVTKEYGSVGKAVELGNGWTLSERVYEKSQ